MKKGVSMSNSDKDQKYKYIFKQEGDIVRKPTNKDYNLAVVRKNSALTGLEGADDYSDFAKKRAFGGYKYDLGKDNVISDFNGTAKNKRSNKKIGTAFTVSDDRVAEDLYKLVAGNSNVEYGKLKYQNLENTDGKPNEIKYDIWTEAKNGSISGNHVVDKLQTKDLIEYTHSHPFRTSYDNDGHFNHSMQIPSGNDLDFYDKVTNHINNYNNIAKGKPNTPTRSNLTTNIYHPWTNDAKKIPYKNEFNHSLNISDQLKSNYTQTLESEVGRKR